MKTVVTSQVVKIPSGVTIEVNGRKVTVKGPRGILVKDFGHVDIEIIASKEKVKIQVWFGLRKHNACIRTVTTHIQNMIKGVTKGFQYKMKAVYAHFPINVNITPDGKTMEIRNFLGEKVVRKISMLDGVKVATTGVKDEIALTGNNIESVSQSAASIQQSVLVRGKDIRKFLDGIYVAEKGEITVKK